MVCRKAHASAFNPFFVVGAGSVEIEGATRSWLSSPDYDRQFCEQCGSRVLAVNGDEIELSMASLDKPGQLEPQYESWVARREPWLTPLDVPQFQKNRHG